MKNASSAYRGAPMPGGRSFTQFRAARIRRVSFQWEQAARPQCLAPHEPPGQVDEPLSGCQTPGCIAAGPEDLVRVSDTGTKAPLGPGHSPA
jgi:hypothetical protein